MTKSETSADQLPLPSIALELFKVRSMQHGVGPKQLAIDCFRDAKAFLDVCFEVEMEAINLASADANPLDAACAPNLKNTHPINLMSRQMGDIASVQKAFADLEANPAADSYKAYDWGRAEVNQARALFPAVINRARQLALAK